jgi:hypothetical protein
MWNLWICGGYNLPSKTNTAKHVPEKNLRTHNKVCLFVLFISSFFLIKIGIDLMGVYYCSSIRFQTRSPFIYFGERAKMYPNYIRTSTLIYKIFQYRLYVNVYPISLQYREYPWTERTINEKTIQCP